jgi:hypothetical protein
MVTYGNLMTMVDMKNRWIYKGSVTTPPCAGHVYWNVVRKVYPIKAKHLNLFKAQLDRVTGLKAAGNWRRIQETTEAHNLSYVRSYENEGFFAGPLYLVKVVVDWMMAILNTNA